MAWDPNGTSAPRVPTQANPPFSLGDRPQASTTIGEPGTVTSLGWYRLIERGVRALERIEHKMHS